MENSNNFAFSPSGKLKPVKGPYGEKFGRLTVLYFSYFKILKNGKNRIYYDTCQCDCGIVKTVSRNDLYSGAVKSCGCLRKELVSERATTHGLHSHPLYQVRQTIIQRCYNPKATGYPWYGAMGVTVCDRWLESFENFLADVGERPIGMSIDRIDPYGNYEPGNVRWADRETQLANKRTIRASAKEKENITETYGFADLCKYDSCNVYDYCI